MRNRLFFVNRFSYPAINTATDIVLQSTPSRNSTPYGLPEPRQRRGSATWSHNLILCAVSFLSLSGIGATTYERVLSMVHVKLLIISCYASHNKLRPLLDRLVLASLNHHRVCDRFSFMYSFLGGAVLRRELVSQYQRPPEDCGSLRRE